MARTSPDGLSSPDMEAPEPLAPEDEAEIDRTLNRVYAVIQITGAVLSLWVLWDYIKDMPDVVVYRERVKGFLETQVGRLRKSRDIEKAERHAVFEAIQIVGEAENA